MHILEVAYIRKTPLPLPPPKTQALSNPAPTALSVLYKNQKNVRMGSEIFRSQLFDEFPYYPTPSVIHRFRRLGRIIETQLYYLITIRLCSLLRPNSLHTASVPTSERTVRYDAAALETFFTSPNLNSVSLPFNTTAFLSYWSAEFSSLSIHGGFNGSGTAP